MPATPLIAHLIHRFDRMVSRYCEIDDQVMTRRGLDVAKPLSEGSTTPCAG